MKRTDGNRKRVCGRAGRGLRMILAVLFCVFLAGCAGKQNNRTLEDGQYYTYYVNQAGTALISRVYEPQTGDTEGIIAELLEQCQTVPEGSDGRRAIPANVTLSEPASLKNGIVTIYFDTTYTLMDQVTELLCKAALAKTITQLDEVEYISIYVNGKPYTGNGLSEDVEESNLVNAEPVLLSASDFVDNTGDATNQYTQADLVLYFANEEGTALVAEERSVVYPSSRSLERVVLNQLIEGPKTEGNTATLPSSLKVQDVSLREGVCYVDFDSTFLEEPMNVTDSIEIYSVVNSLTELESVKQVQITINGSANETFRNNIPLSGRFEKDLSYIEQEEETEIQTP